MAYIIAIDQGTTSSRAILFNEQREIIDVRQKETKQYYPNPGWVEQDPKDIWGTSYGVMQELLATHAIRADEISAIGITNQRETTIVWEKATGKPVHPAIVWQCRRTADVCEKIKTDGWSKRIVEKTGLVVDAYFSATKLAWILDQIDPNRERAQKGEILFGTVDSWLLWNLTQGKVHATDYTNASRTMMYNIHKLVWDEEILDYLNIPKAMLPKVFPSGHIYGKTILGQGISVPIAALVGDQQSALYGQHAFLPGEAKNTYGTGCFLLMNIGKKPIVSRHGLLTTIAAGSSPEPNYALEGSIFVGGAVIQWLRDEMRLIEDAADSAFFARKLADNQGVYLVPAFVGLGAPHWDMYARGAIYGLTRGSGRAHIIRAALESIAYQTRDVLKTMEIDSDIKVQALKVDGGAAANEFLMQFQADILNVPVVRSNVLETTALGSAMLAGETVGLWTIDKQREDGTRFKPQMEETVRHKNLEGWEKALRSTVTTK